MKSKSNSLFGAAIVLATTVTTAFAGTTAPAAMETPPPSSPWTFRTELYGWLTGLDGTIGVRGVTTDTNVNFNDIIDKIDMVATMQFEARNGRWGIIADGMYVKLSESGSSPGPLQLNASVEMKQFIGELYGAYRVSESPSGFFDFYAGMRYNYLSVNLQATGKLPIDDIDKTQSKNWIDPMIGLRGQWNITDKFFLAGKGDIGGFDVNSQLAWSVQATLGYNFTPSLSAELGYRYLSTDYTDGGFTYDINQAGVYTGFNIKF